MDHNEEGVDLSQFGREIEDRTAILNSFFKFKKEFMNDDSIMDALNEYANKNEYNVILLAQELSEIPGFVDIVKQDCIKFKYSINLDGENISDEWE